MHEVAYDSVRELPLHDRKDAGRRLAGMLRKKIDVTGAIVLALPRGGVPVAYEIASLLDLELDLITVRKLGLPQQEELAMGAIASGGVRVLNSAVVGAYLVPEHVIDEVANREGLELARRERAYRRDRPRPALEGRHVVLVDDGIATGSTMQAAIEAVRALKPERISVAVPVAPPSTVKDLQPLVDALVCVATPERFGSVGQWYVTFGQTSDDEVKQLLSDAWRSKR